MRYKILIVEDVKIAQKVAILRLTELGCDVDAVETGAQALERIQTQQYDLIFMDLGLEDMEGFAVAEKIREIEKHRHVPIIALTAHDNPDIRKECLSKGIDDFLIKPLTLEGGKRVLEKYVHK